MARFDGDQRPEGRRQRDNTVNNVIFVPFKEKVWRDQADYFYDGEKTKFFGTFGNVQGVDVYAPESGTIYPRPDGGMVLSVTAEESASDTNRQWLMGPIKFSDGFRNGDRVQAGQHLGTVDGSEMKIALFAAPEGSDKFQGLDPVELLQKVGATFPDDQDDKAPPPKPSAKKEPEKTFNFGDLLLAVGGGTLLGAAVGWGIKK